MRANLAGQMGTGDHEGLTWRWCAGGWEVWLKGSDAGLRGQEGGGRARNRARALLN